ncbi:MAG: pyridoxamine 5'-phosphate oxidase family protein [Candidatus Nitrosotenuis sp.]|nr:pyridoxamine 5'-phosphate oxidase family protein [Candidatus Nitrosotenuis sp.]
MFSREKFLKKQKVLRLATMDKKGNPHLVPVWYKYSAKKFYIGTSSKSQKARNVKVNRTVCFCVDDGIWHPIYGVMGVGKAKLILRKSKVKRMASSILLRYFKSLNVKSAKELLEQTDCIIEITPKKITSWQY